MEKVLGRGWGKAELDEVENWKPKLKPKGRGGGWRPYGMDIGGNWLPIQVKLLSKVMHAL